MSPEPTEPPETPGPAPSGPAAPAAQSTRMLTALVQLRSALQGLRSRWTCRAWRSSVRPAARWSTSSRTTSSRA